MATSTVLTVATSPTYWSRDPKRLEPPKWLTDSLNRHFGPNAHNALQIAWCESKFRHHDESGDVLRNHTGSSAVGVFQIMLFHHEAPALQANIDLMTLDGNIEYAAHLFNTKGWQPWLASIDCWLPLIHY